MLSLEKVLDDPRRAGITDILVLFADPYGDFEAMNGGPLRPDQEDDLIKALKEHFAYGESLISRFRYDLMGIESWKGGLQRTEVTNAFDLLSIFLGKNRQPSDLDKRLGRIYKENERTVEALARAYVRNAPIDLSIPIEGVEGYLLLLLHYTHLWHRHVFKKVGTNPFEPLAKVPIGSVEVGHRMNPNTGFPNYSVSGWIERVKSKERAKRKILYKIFKYMEGAGADKEKFYQETFGTDYFGVKIIGAGATIMGKKPRLRAKIEGYLTREDSPWTLGKIEDYAKTKRGKYLASHEYLLQREDDAILLPDILQLQVVNLVNFLLDDFFAKDSRLVFNERRDKELEAYRRKYQKLYAKMYVALDRALAFLP